LAKVLTIPHCAILGATLSHIWGNHLHLFKSKKLIAPRVGVKKLTNSNLMHFTSSKKKLKNYKIRTHPKRETNTKNLNYSSQLQPTSTIFKVLSSHLAEKLSALVTGGRLIYN
jgi:hypothetical protein